MKSIIFILLACLSGLFFSCNKQNNNQALATDLPAELSYLKGTWDVVDYYVDSGWQDTQQGAQPGFNYMKLGAHSVSFYSRGDEIKSGSFRFTKNDKNGIYRFTFLSEENSLTQLDFYVRYESDTLYLNCLWNDGGTSYALVRE